MRYIKRISALCLSLMMVFSIIIASGVTTASAVQGAGLQQTTFRSYGVDLSFWNVSTSSGNDYSLIDFAKMKADGCEFVILRLGYEGSKTREDTLDTAFLEFYKRARAAGMPLGLYFYGLSTTKEGAIADAKWVIDVIESNNMYFEYPIYYDIEDNTYTFQVQLGSAAMEQLCLGWCETLEAAGYFPGIYGGGSQVINKLSDDFKSKYDLWYPRYKTYDPNDQYNPADYDYSDYCGIWQFASCGYTYDGVGKENIDVNVCYKDYPAIMKQYGYNNCGDSEAKSALRDVVNTAEALRHNPYSESQIAAIRTAYDNAVSVLGNSSSTDAAYTSARDALYNAINNTSSTLSVGKSYTVSANPRDDIWKDDGKRLTDGAMSTLPGDTKAYSGLGMNTVDITVDLGSGAGTHNTYRIYIGVNSSWSITVPAEIKVSVSSDGNNFTQIASATTASAVAQSDAWSAYILSAHTDSSSSERYVRFTVVPGAGHIWLDEVTVSMSETPIQNGVYINGINEKITAGDCHVFTPDFGEITTATANHTWTRNVLVKWDSSQNIYVVQRITTGYGSETPSITLSAGELLISAHCWEGEGVENPIAGSKANYDLLSTLKEGDTVSFNGIDVANNKRLVASYMTVDSSEASTPAPDISVTPVADNLATNKSYVTSDVYAADGVVQYPDEGGITLTDGKNAVADALFSDSAFVGFNKNSDDYKVNGYSYITVDLGKVYSVDKFVAHVASKYNTSAGIHAPSEIKVYVSEDNDTWTEAGSVTPVDTDAVSTVSAKVELEKSVSARYVQFCIVAASEKSWMFVSEIEVHEGEAVVVPNPVYLLGDVNNDTKVDSVDYLLVKRHCFGTYVLTDDEYLRANVDKSERVDSVDYVLVKRIAFGTYTA